MAQRVCSWCAKVGIRVAEADLDTPEAAPHADGTLCVCRHVTCRTRKEANREGGRYWDGRCWVCLGCRQLSGLAP